LNYSIQRVLGAGLLSPFPPAPAPFIAVFCLPRQTVNTTVKSQCRVRLCAFNSFAFPWPFYLPWACVLYSVLYCSVSSFEFTRCFVSFQHLLLLLLFVFLLFARKLFTLIKIMCSTQAVGNAAPKNCLSVIIKSFPLPAVR